MTHAIGSQREDDVGAAIYWEEEQEPSRMAQARRIPIGRPFTAGDRRQQILRWSAWERMLQRLANLLERSLEGHIDICGQLADGVGNDEAVTARTTSAAISA
jgi:hypothetical protein